MINIINRGNIITIFRQIAKRLSDLTNGSLNRNNALGHMPISSMDMHIGRYAHIDPCRYRICDIHIGRYAHIGPYGYPIFDIHIGRYELIDPYEYPISDIHIGRYALIGIYRYRICNIHISKAKIGYSTDQPYQIDPSFPIGL